MEPAVVKRLLRRDIVAVISRRDAAASHTYLAVNDSDLAALKLPSDRTDAVCLGQVRRHYRRALGYAVALQNRYAERGEKFNELLIQRRSAAEEISQLAAEDIVHLGKKLSADIYPEAVQKCA